MQVDVDVDVNVNEKMQCKGRLHKSPCSYVEKRAFWIDFEFTDTVNNYAIM